MGKRQAARGPRSGKAEILTGVLTATRCDPQVKTPAPGFYTGSRPTDGRRLRQPAHTLPPRTPALQPRRPALARQRTPASRSRHPRPFPPARPSTQMSWLLSPARSPPATLAIASSSRSAARRAGTCTLQPIRCSSTSIPASVYSTPNRRQTDLSDPRQRPALILIPPPGRRAGIQHRLQLAHLSRGRVCTAPRPPPWRPAPPGHRPPAPAATGSPTSATPGTAGPPPGRWPRPRSTPRLPAAPAPGGPAPPRPARHHRDTSCLRHTAPQRQPSPGRNPRN